MKRSFFGRRVLRLAGKICEAKRSGYYDPPTWVAPESGNGLRAPCRECIQGARARLRKLQKTKSRKKTKTITK